MVRAALDGRLAEIETRRDPNFGLAVPISCPDVPADLLWPRNTWKDGALYDRSAYNLQSRFEVNFEQFKAFALKEKTFAST
jgi:phosphoenolpyruvate carboxykinase (ATP)